MKQIATVAGNEGDSAVMKQDTATILLERFYSAHIHCVPIVAIIKGGGNDVG
jgi:hypothetical protein